MIVALAGNNALMLRKRLDELTGQFVAEHGEFALEKIDAEAASAQDILDAISNLPFLASRKMVVVRSLGVNKEASGQIEQIISSAGDTTDLILYEPATDKRTVYYKTLKSQTQLEEFNELDTSGLARWLVEEAKNQGAELTLGDANYLVERVGQNQLLLSNELAKLITYDRKITRESIDLLTEKTPQSRVFDLLDAAFGQNKKRALELYEEQRAQKVEPQAILALIAWQLQVVALAKYAKGKSPGDIAKDTGLNPYPITKAQRLASKLSDEKLRDMVAEALKIDIASKKSPIDVDEALKTYIATI
jgi:DNA polymerase-3 subunit delta